jgi:DNA-binding transcriptional MerR regulator
MAENIPDRMFYRIKEVCDITGLKPYVLRYWEQEFKDIRPSKSSTGQRLYKRKDLDTIFVIKKLLYEKRYTIDGAKKYLLNQKKLLGEIRQDLLEIKDMLEKGEKT